MYPIHTKTDKVTQRFVTLHPAGVNTCLTLVGSPGLIGTLEPRVPLLVLRGASRLPSAILWLRQPPSSLTSRAYQPALVRP